jgi:hypothetical protein
MQIVRIGLGISDLVAANSYRLSVTNRNEL